MTGRSSLNRRTSTHEPRAGATRFVPGLVVLVLGSTATVLAWRLGVGSLAHPGPGLWPIMAGLALCVLAAVHLLTATRGDRPEAPAVRALGMAVATLALFIVAVQFAGLVVSSCLALVVLLRLLAHESWRLALTSGAITAVALYVVFVVLLNVPIPPGFLGP